MSDRGAIGGVRSRFGRVSTRDAKRIVRNNGATVTREHRDVAMPLRGEIPRDLRGVLYRNGPGRLERGGVAYGHLFDGDGMICRYAFDDDGVRFSNRFVRTRWWQREEASDRILYRGFGTNRPGGIHRNLFRLRFKNAANTHVVPHADRLLALWEGGHPHRIDPSSLETMGTEDFGGRLNNPFGALEAWLSPTLPFAAHPKIDPQTGELFGFGIVYGHVPRLLVYRVGPSGAMDEPRVIELDALAFVHDFALTDNWLIFLLPEVTFDVARALAGLATPAGSLQLNADRPMTALLVPRRGGPLRRIEICTGFVFHVAGAWEDDLGRLHLDAVRFASFPDLSSFDVYFDRPDPATIPRPVRLTLDPASRRYAIESLGDHATELPRVAPTRGPHRCFWAIGAPPGRRVPLLSAVLRVDRDGRVTMRDLYPDLPSEPVPADPRGRWLLVPVYRSDRHLTELLVLDGETLEDIACATAPTHVPTGFHGSFVTA